MGDALCSGATKAIGCHEAKSDYVLSNHIVQHSKSMPDGIRQQHLVSHDEMKPYMFAWKMIMHVT